MLSVRSGEHCAHGEIEAGEHVAAGEPVLLAVDGRGSPRLVNHDRAFVRVDDPGARTVTTLCREGARGPRVLEETDTLDGGNVLPGFALDLSELFD